MLNVPMPAALVFLTSPLATPTDRPSTRLTSAGRLGAAGPIPNKRALLIIFYRRLPNLTNSSFGFVRACVP